MRLAYLSTDPGIAYGDMKGASVHLGEIVAALVAEGNELLVLVAGVASGVSPRPGVTVEVLPGPGKGALAGERLRFQDELAAWLEQRLERFAAKGLYERLALHSAAGAAVARRLGIPHLLEVNAPLLEEAARYRTLEEPEAAERLERLTLAAADRVFAVSPPLADYAKLRGASRVEVLQNAAAIDRFPPPSRGRENPVAVFAGSLRPWHGLEAIVEAWGLLGTAAPPLLVIGDGPARALLNGLEATVTGPVPPAEVPALLMGADIGLAPYSVDAPGYFSPLKLFEYLAAGLATVVADLPAVRAVVDDDSAILVTPGDAAVLADVVASLCADLPERRRLGRNGRALVEARHTWRHRAKRVLEVAAELEEARMVTA
jgi:glycosyltransferase involved in cell wall biosynthesis